MYTKCDIYSQKLENQRRGEKGNITMCVMDTIDRVILYQSYIRTRAFCQYYQGTIS